MTVKQLQAELAIRDKGVLKAGSHKVEEREFCALEFVSVLHDEPLNDKPGHLPDLRSLNDGLWKSDISRTESLLPVIAALWDWNNWSLNRKDKWAETVVVQTVNRIISRLPELSRSIITQCENATTLEMAARAARAADAADAAVDSAADEAVDTANAAYSAANAARAAANAANAANAAYAAYAANAARAAAYAARAAADAAAYAAYAAACGGVCGGCGGGCSAGKVR